MVRQEVRVGLFPAKVSPAAKFAANARKEPARGLPLLHPAVRPEPPAGQSVRQPVMPVIRLIIPVPQRLVLPVRLMPTETAAPIRYGQLTAIIPAMTNAEPALQPAKRRPATKSLFGRMTKAASWDCICRPHHCPLSVPAAATSSPEMRMPTLTITAVSNVALAAMSMPHIKPILITIVPVPELRITLTVV